MGVVGWPGDELCTKQWLVKLIIEMGGFLVSLVDRCPGWSIAGRCLSGNLFAVKGGGWGGWKRFQPVLLENDIYSISVDL